MNDARIPAILYVCLLALAVLQWVHVYPQLPAVMASHFGGHGVPNGWQTKQVFFLLMGIVALIPTIPAFITPRHIAMMSPDKINLPNKAYWLAPERREETWRFIGAQMAWFGCALLFLLLYGTSQAINANLPGGGRFNWEGMRYALGGSVLFVILWLIHFVRHFYQVPEADFSSSSR